MKRLRSVFGEGILFRVFGCFVLTIIAEIVFYFYHNIIQNANFLFDLSAFLNDNVIELVKMMDYDI